MAWRRSKRQGVGKGDDGTAAVGSLGSGILGGLLASLCCLPPALALALGLGGSTLLVSLGAYGTEFHLAGLGLTLVAAWWIRRRRVKACRTDRSPIPFLLLAVGSFVAAYLALVYVVTPFLYGIYARR